MGVTVALFAAGICLGISGAIAWAWAVRSGQFRNLEKTKDQLFWPDIAESAGEAGAGRTTNVGRTRR